MEIKVVGAVIVQGGQVLAARRGPNMTLAGMWEFPGGKVKPGESAAGALQREVLEELCCTVDVGARVVSTRHDYPFGTVALSTFYASILRGAPTATEHSELRWVPVHMLHLLDWAPADIPTVAEVMRNF